MSLSNRKSLSKAIMLIGAIILISPIFGIILSDTVVFHEPLDLTAEELGLQDSTEAPLQDEPTVRPDLASVAPH